MGQSVSQSTFITRLGQAVGPRHVLTREVAIAPYCRGFRFGSGTALAVVRPGSLVELWQVLGLCVTEDVAIVMQAANTGLTGGSTPLPAYDRPAVVISTLRIDRTFLIRGNRQAICLAGATLQGLEQALDRVGRAPHSVLGSSCIGASVIGGVCNNSGGALVERGPAYTELSLYACMNGDGDLELVNALGVSLGDTPEEMLRRLESGDFDESDIAGDDRLASDREYVTRVRDIDSPEPARYNADPRRLFDSSGCAGKLAVFAVRVDTFEKHAQEKTFFISTNRPSHLETLRRRILGEVGTLPVSAEYIHRDTLQLAIDYGRDTVWAINTLGTRRIPWLFRARARCEAFLARRLGASENFTERMLQAASKVLPRRVPRSVRKALAACEQHLILKARDEGIAEIEALLEGVERDLEIRYFACSPREAKLIGLYRFAAAGAAIRYAACHRAQSGGIVALDIALPRNTRYWLEALPPRLDAKILKKCYYGHFLCHIMHQDYIVRAGEDVDAVKEALLEITRERGARYPAEHNHGHVYEAPKEVKAFYRASDPTNTFNPGVGGMSPLKDYR